MKISGEREVKPTATIELDRAITYRVLRAEASEMVELEAVCMTKCSVVSAVINAGFDSGSIME